MSAQPAVTNENFEESVLKAEGLVLVDFWASWCMPCKMLDPIIDQLAEEHKEKVKIVALDTDANLETAQNYSITGIPTVMLFKNGEVVERMVGVQPKKVYDELIAKHSN